MGALIASLLATLQLLLSAVGSHAIIERTAPDPSPLGFVAGDTACARWVFKDGAWRCPDNVWRVRFAPEMDFGAIGSSASSSSSEDLRRAVAIATLVHELAHVYDGMDDGQFNGSRGHPRPDDYIEASRLTGVRQAWEPSPWYCWAAGADGHGTFNVAVDDRARAEWYACEVTRTGRLD